VRALALLLLLACGFGLAALWQARRLDELHAHHEAAEQVAKGHLGETESGLVAAGSGVITVGRPSGAAPLEGGADGAPDGATGETDVGAFEHPDLPDFELEVHPGQTLSKIAATHYGAASNALVLALARYNGLQDADLLRVGDVILLPEIEELER
jgi:nucleoid-associated protein YgaU